VQSCAVGHDEGRLGSRNEGGNEHMRRQPRLRSGPCDRGAVVAAEGRGDRSWSRRAL
jgi:hypothetical protein